VVTREEVIEALKKVYDPEIPINVVDLGLIYRVDVVGDVVHIDMTTTAPGCPMAYYIVAMVRRAVLSVPGVKDVKIRLVWDPPWSPDRATEEGRRRLRELYPWLFK